MHPASAKHERSRTIDFRQGVGHNASNENVHAQANLLYPAVQRAGQISASCSATTDT
jgi:hypothetical protein